VIRLLNAETKRLFARRMTRFFPLVLAGLMVGGIVIAYFVINADDGNSPDFLTDMAGGIGATDVLGPITDLLPVMAFVIGASFIGADLKTGMVEQLLTWEPRRLRFLAARAIAVASGVALLAMVLSALMVGLLYGLAASTGTTDGTTGEMWVNVTTIILRTGVAAGLFAVFGLAITLLVNNSVGSIVGFVIYWFIIENFLVAAFLPKVAVYLPITNASSFASSRDVERIEGSVFSSDFISHHAYLTAGVILLVWTAVALVAAGVVFQRRDVA